MKTLSNKLKEKFLLQFTRELIFNSAGGEFIQLQNALKEQIKEELVQSVKEEEKPTKEKLNLDDLDFSEPLKKKKKIFHKRKRRLFIPESKLPPHLQYLKPTPKNINIEIEKLDDLIKDPAVKVIECNGADEHVIVRGNMGVKPTATVLSQEEIDEIIQQFSNISKIPIHQGIYSVVAGRLVFSAIISDVVGSKFMIKKMLYAPYFQGQVYPNPVL